MTWTQIDENEIKPNEEKLEAILKLKSPEKTKDIKTFLGAIQNMAKYLPKLSEQTDRLRKLLKRMNNGNGDRNKRRNSTE